MRELREGEKDQEKEVQKCLEKLEKRFYSVKEHIQCYEKKRGELIESGVIPEDTPQFTFKTANYKRVMEASFSLIHESLDNDGKISAKIACGFSKVMDRIIDKERNRYLVQEGRSYEYTLKDEATQLKKLKERTNNQFPCFADSLNIETPPLNYNPKKRILLGSKEEVEIAEKYLKENSKKIAIDGPMRVIRQANLAVECTKLEAIENDDDSTTKMAKELKNSSMMMLNKLNDALLNRTIK